MLKSLDSPVNADVLHALCAMGHGDEVVICDANFPADSVSRQTVLGRVLRLDGVNSPRAIRAVLSVLPLASLSVTRPGTAPSMPTLAEIEAVLLGEPVKSGSASAHQS